MFRKTALALTTIATLGAAALVPTTASAGYYGYGYGYGPRYYGYCFWKPFYGYYGYKRWVKICL